MYRRPANRKFSNKVFFVTAVTRERYPFFKDDHAAQTVLDSLQYFRAQGQAELFAYVIMPDHLHMMIEPLSPWTLPKIIRRFKSFTARIVTDGGLWEEGYFSEIITNEKIFRQKLDYIHMNPVKKSIVENPGNYYWSSSKEYLRGEPYLTIDYYSGPPTLKAVGDRH